jgi:hypothetical protein
MEYTQQWNIRSKFLCRIMLQGHREIKGKARMIKVAFFIVSNVNISSALGSTGLPDFRPDKPFIALDQKPRPTAPISDPEEIGDVYAFLTNRCILSTTFYYILLQCNPTCRHSGRADMRSSSRLVRLLDLFRAE